MITLLLLIIALTLVMGADFVIGLFRVILKLSIAVTAIIVLAVISVRGFA